MQDSRTRAEGALAPAAPGSVDGADVERDDEILDDVLVEDVSIDGMCGVY